MAGIGMSSFESSAVAPLGAMQSVSMSRPQVGIERLPTRRMSNEPRESMNCKSCRKRKIKCNRLRPSCEACQVFQCPCIYDAVPKKRGPKTDVLEALLKRVDGLEQKLKEKKESAEPTSETAPTETADASSSTASGPAADSKTVVPPSDTSRAADVLETAVFSPSPVSEPSPAVPPEALVDTYFSRFHAKPFYVLDESSVRQRLQLNQLPNYLLHAVYAVAARYTPHPSGYQFAVKLGQEYMNQARSEIDIDEPSVDALQACLLLVTAFTAAGKGKKAYMLLANAVGMAMALESHREMDIHARVTPVEREVRRRLFWTCYLLDRFMACGSKRPSLVSDNAILLRLPCWSPSPSALPIEGDFFHSGSNLQYFQGSGKKPQGSSGMLIDISRILGTTNRYLAAGGVKGDSHFPWHSLSNLSKIRQDLDVWASGTDDVFSSLETLFGQPDSTVLVLSKLIYHLIHCLIYRPFLPIDLAELAVSGQHQSWQIEATNMCFLHANAIAELVELGKQSSTIEWPSFVGYCICTAGTVHIHGAHYNKHGPAGDMSVFSSSAEFLSREMQQLSELRYAWASVQHQRETLQGIYNAHTELVKSLSNTRYAPVFHLEDFFDRYANIGGPGGQSFSFDAANLSLSDVTVDFTADTYTGHEIYAPRVNGLPSDLNFERPSLKRKNTAQGARRSNPKSLAPIAGNVSHHINEGLPTPAYPRHASFSANSLPPQMSPMLHSPASLPPHHDLAGQQPPQQQQHMGGMPESAEEAANNAAVAAAAAAGFSIQGTQMPSLPTTPFNSSLYNSYASLAPATPGPGGGTAGATNGHGAGRPGSPQHATSSPYDPMFGTLPTNAISSPAAWHGGENGHHEGLVPGQGQPSLAHSPNAASSNNGSTGEEKDPFLSLLEQLADSEQAKGPGNELDFFFGGPLQQ